MGRSGSTLLQKLLDSHPSIMCDGEILNEASTYAKNDNIPIARYIADHFRERDGVVGFKAPWDSIILYPDALGALKELDFKIIFLKRADKLDHFLSMRLAQINNLWDSGREYDKNIVETTTQELNGFFISSEYTDMILAKMCARYSATIHTTYEEVVSGASHARMLEFLGVENLPLTTTTVRSRVVPKRAALADFDKLAASFDGTPYRRFFVDD